MNPLHLQEPGPEEGDEADALVPGTLSLGMGIAKGEGDSATRKKCVFWLWRVIGIPPPVHADTLTEAFEIPRGVCHS